MSISKTACLIVVGLWMALSTEAKIGGGISTFEKDLSLNLKERQALDIFKGKVGDLPQEYMSTDIYLIKWLRAAKLDVSKAQQMLENHLQWRKQHRLDSILEEDFSHMSSEFPMDLEGVDYNGAPVIAITRVGDGDFRKAVVSGNTDKLYRYMMSRVELAAKKVRDAQAKGLNVTRFHFIENLNGFNLAQHACVQCMPIHIKIIQGFQVHYPGMVDKIVYVNAPAVFDTALRVVINFVSEELKNSLKVFGTNKAEWQKYLFEIIPPEQLDVNFGGTKVSKRDV